MRLLSIALPIGVTAVDCHFAKADSQFNVSSGFWATSTNWFPSGVPAGGSVVDLFKAPSTCIYNVAVATQVDLSAVQVANGSTLSMTTLYSPNSTLDTGALEVGGTNTGLSGRGASTGAGIVSESAGFVTIDPAGVLAVDSASSYTLSGSANLTALTGANEILAGTFTQSGGINEIYAGGTFNNSGNYLLQNFSGAAIMCDSFINTGSFNQSGSTVEGYTNISTGSFNNSGTYFYSLGNFLGVMNNFASVQVNGAAIPFSKGIVNNGLLTLNGSTGSFSGVISGSGSNAAIVVKGASNVTLAGSNNYSGSTTVSAGTLILGAPVGTSGNLFGSALQGNVSIGALGTLQLNAADQISNNVQLTINGGTLNLNGNDESVGSLIMDAGSVLESSAGPGLGVTTGQITIGTGSATINGGLRSANPLNFNIATGNTVTVYGSMGSYNTAGQALVLSGGGTLYFSGASNLSSITINSGILQVAEGGNLSGSNLSLALQTGGSLSLNNQSLTVGDLSGSSTAAISLGTGSLTVSSTVGSTYPGTINGNGSFYKAGLGSLVLSGVDSSAGSVSVTQGTLTLASSGSMASSSMSVASLATLNINGTLTGSPSIAATGTVNFGPNTGSGFLLRTVGPISFGITQTAGNGQVNIAPASPHTNRTLLIAGGLTFSGTTNAWLGQLDLSNNDLVVQNGSIANITNQVANGYNASAGGNWSGQGITSSAAAADTTHLTAVGVILNDIGGGTPLYGLGGVMGNFDATPGMPLSGYNAQASDVLLKFTYFGDANLDGQVDGADYSLIDNGSLRQLTGWFNGDFNYDGVINGSDYTLIDNAFNTQGGNLTTNAQIAAITTAQIAGQSAVPEPATLGVLAISAMAFLSRRRSSR